MKLKTATLLALIPLCIVLICSLINMIINFADIEYSDGLRLWYKLSNVPYFLLWGGLVYFFYTLYKNQK